MAGCIDVFRRGSVWRSRSGRGSVAEAEEGAARAATIRAKYVCTLLGGHDTHRVWRHPTRRAPPTHKTQTNDPSQRGRATADRRSASRD
ncbi:unnamed protein product [Vitrella brassicaformis CCMP3155]|uniref:Uncharacterized protein n=1 Tax=Vitrella brassicaformis (strain CCMP3155) TaxID=1169540 RepID=A0A0G4EAA5_VITBC|nr:unnamed protein product [Vitrella brassicaformis CCMP3155]|mmetsp:Transcript_36480/g.104544  ORF Transcript_36480/g.104544 Transcript_36480/m.104544 type:complete len:89 (+) Transcript_36480:146-412(+)|eukprot:CEL92163.1 unnamed protein product [Vitrella brassicaformis CCMP3155]